MKVVITGGAGYVGTELTKILSSKKEVDEILIYDNLSKGHFNFFLGKEYKSPEKVKLVVGEILDSRLLRKHIKDADAIIHLAAKVTTPFANTDPHFFEQVNHWGTAEVVYAAEESDVSKFIYLSSASVYGAGEALIDESTVPTPNTFYGISKLRGEEHVNRLMETKNAVIVRGGNVYGYSRSMRFDAVINRFMFDANYTGRIQIFGNGKQSRAFIHVNHLADTISQALLAEVPSGTYNVVDKNLSVLDIVDVLKEMYPALEFIFSVQHMNLRELKISKESRLFQHVNQFEVSDLKQELQDFKDHFSF